MAGLGRVVAAGAGAARSERWCRGGLPMRVASGGASAVDMIAGAARATAVPASRFSYRCGIAPGRGERME